MAPAYSHAHWRENWILEAMMRERSLQSGRDPSVASRSRCEYERGALSPRPIAMAGIIRAQKAATSAVQPLAIGPRIHMKNMLPPRSYRPPMAITRGPRLATRGRKLPRSSWGFRGRVRDLSH
eukprot:scaffold2109_cov123-Isochrysis_galbana.AAC.17